MAPDTPPRGMSALPPKADIAECDGHVRFVPKADILRCGRDWRYSITSSARETRVAGTFSPSALAVLRLITSSNLVGPSKHSEHDALHRAGTRPI
jgi:hypothetical protein